MKELIYKFPNPHNVCEDVYYCTETNRYYILMPYMPYSKQLCTCTHYQSYYEADGPVRAGLSYLINGNVVTTEGDGEIVDYVKKEEYENREMVFFKLKDEYSDLSNYQWIEANRVLQRLHDYMDPNHFEEITCKRKDVYCMMGGWFLKKDNV